MAINVTIVGRKTDENWEGAVLSNQRFLRAFIGKDLLKLVTTQLLPYLQSDQPGDTEFVVNLSLGMNKEEEKKEEKKQEVKETK